MTVRKILSVPNPTLRRRSKDIEVVSPEITTLAKEMTETLIAYSHPHEIGAALAAPQIGELFALTTIRRDFNVDIKKLKNPAKNFFTILNPEIVERSDEKSADMEGCLSIPGVYGRVNRATEVVVRALDLKGRPVTLRAKEFMARVLQHEIDHLHGILFTDRVEGARELYRMSKDGELKPNNSELRT